MMKKLLIGAGIAALLSCAAMAQFVVIPGPGTGPYGPVPIGTPVLIASKTIATAPPASTTLLTSIPTVSGDLLACYVTWTTNNSISVASISDGTNSYSSVSVLHTGSFIGAEWWIAGNASATPSGTTITVTWSGAGAGGSSGTSVYCFHVNGIMPTSPFDVQAQSATNTTTPSVTLATLSKANELILSSSYNSNQQVVYTESSGYTNLVKTTGGAFGLSVGIGFKVVAVTTGPSYNPSWAASAAVAMATQAIALKGN